jgi:site-specific DNA-methyltransferase (adenine-specific)
VDCVVTSPPYWGLRTYGDSGLEIGRDSSDQYLRDLRFILEEIRRVLKDDGTVWINIGDTASGSGGSGGDYAAGGRKSGKQGFRQGDAIGISRGSWCLIPERFAIGAIARGWLLRSEVVWDKGIVRPESIKHVRRPLLRHEKIFMLTKSMNYKFYGEERVDDVWQFSPAKGKSGSIAPFPEELPRRCISLSTSPGDIVFDPFAGANTTSRVANAMGRVGIGMDLYGDKWI